MIARRAAPPARQLAPAGGAGGRLVMRLLAISSPEAKEA
jgi:hypothetical protein